MIYQHEQRVEGSDLEACFENPAILGEDADEACVNMIKSLKNNTWIDDKTKPLPQSFRIIIEAHYPD